MGPKSNLGLLLSLVLFFVVSATPPSVYDVLPKYGLPSGLFPSSVSDFYIASDGRFMVHLTETCYVQFDYLVYYERTISGKLSSGSIKDLKGMQVQPLLLWYDVDEINVDSPPSDGIYFRVGWSGWINKKLNISQFEMVHSCRDSLSCGRSWKWAVESPTLDETKMLPTE